MDGGDCRKYGLYDPCVYMVFWVSNVGGACRCRPAVRKLPLGKPTGPGGLGYRTADLGPTNHLPGNKATPRLIATVRPLQEQFGGVAFDTNRP